MFKQYIALRCRRANTRWLLLPATLAMGACSLIGLDSAYQAGPSDLPSDPPPERPIEVASSNCDSGETRSCYGGAAETEGVGPCRAGVETCVEGQWSGSCEGEVMPAAQDLCEPLAGFQDDNCDGSLSGDTELGFVIGGAGVQEVQDIATDSQGNIFMVGRFSVELVIPGLNEPILQEPGTALNMFIVKLTPEGQHLWHRTYGYQDPRFPTPGSLTSDWLMNFCHYGVAPVELPSCRIAVDNNDDLIVTGPIPAALDWSILKLYGVGSYDFDGGPAGGPNPEAGVAFVAKYQGNAQGVGKLLWSETIKGAPSSSRITEIAIAGPNHDIVLAGVYYEINQTDVSQLPDGHGGLVWDKGCVGDCLTLVYRGEDLFVEPHSPAGGLNAFAFAIDRASREVLWRAAVREQRPEDDDSPPLPASRQGVVSLSTGSNGLLTVAVTNEQPASSLELSFSPADSESQAATPIPLAKSGADYSMNILKLDPSSTAAPLLRSMSLQDRHQDNWQSDPVFLTTMADADSSLLLAGGFASDFEVGDSPPWEMTSNNGSYDSFIIAADGHLKPKDGHGDGMATVDETTTDFASHGATTVYQLVGHPRPGNPSTPAGLHIDFGDEVRCETDAVQSHCLVRWRWLASESKLEPVWARAIGASGVVDKVGTLDGGGNMIMGVGQNKTLGNKGHGYARITTDQRGALLMAANFKGDLPIRFHHDQIENEASATATTTLTNSSGDSDIYVLRFAP